MPPAKKAATPAKKAAPAKLRSATVTLKHSGRLVGGQP